MDVMNKKAVFITIVSLLIILCHVPYGYTKDPQIGVLMSSNTSYFKDIHKAFIDELLVKGIKVKNIFVQKPAPDTMAWTNAARKYVALDMDVIVTYGGPATLAVLSETSKIPVVFAGVYESKSLGSKGNATGVITKISIAGVLKILKGIKKFSTLGIIYNSAEKSTLDEVAEIERLSGQFSFKPVKFNTRKRGDISKIKNIDAIYITSSCVAAMCVNDIISVARKNKIPTVSTMGGLGKKGVLLTMYADPEQQGKEAAHMLDRILKGENPSSIPEVNSKKIQLVINLKEATTLGLTVPFDIRSVATKVIK
jgi:putative ABC transport system substrate-binding protein